MNRKKVFIEFGLLAFFVSGLASAASVQISDYAFEKSFFLSEDQVNSSSVGIVLELDTLQNINKNISNITLIDEENSLVDFSIALPKAGIVKNLKVLETSSVSKGIKESLIDSNINSKFLFDETVDKKDPSWVLIDMKSPTILNQLQFYKTSDSNISSIQVFGGMAKNNLKPISAKKPFNYFINVKPELVQFIKIEFNGFKVAIEDIFFLKSRNGQIVFDPNKKRRFKLLFGGNIADKPVFKSISASIDSKVNLLFNPKKGWNKFFVTDADEDGIENEKDNCPFSANKNQADSDTDTVGDICDNAPKNKNYNQADSDEDSIGDVIDNCKLFVNPKQADSDNDKKGDACDLTSATIGKDLNGTLQNNKWFLFGLFSVFIISGLIAYFSSTKRKED